MNLVHGSINSFQLHLIFTKTGFFKHIKLIYRLAKNFDSYKKVKPVLETYPISHVNITMVPTGTLSRSKGVELWWILLNIECSGVGFGQVPERFADLHCKQMIPYVSEEQSEQSLFHQVWNSPFVHPNLLRHNGVFIKMQMQNCVFLALW